jgi:ATP-dependent helicase/nuclease subunit A
MSSTERQHEAITTHDRSMVVTAGAGTGKTYVLVRKYLDLIETKGVTVPEILTLTFTEKAAAEMKGRIRTEISRREGRIWEKAAEDFMLAPVQTFHSFCAQVLREFPIETGLDPGFSVLDEQQISRIHASAFETLIHTPQEKGVNHATVQVLSIVETSILKQILTAMYVRRQQYTRFFKIFESDEKSIRAFWQEEICRFRDNEISSLSKDPGFSDPLSILLSLADTYEGTDDKAAVYLQEVRPHLECLSGRSTGDVFCAAGEAFLNNRPGNVGSKKKWNEADLESFKKAKKELIDVLERKKTLLSLSADPDHTLMAASISLLRHLSPVFRRYLGIVTATKAQAGGLDFSDLIFHARRIFTEERELVSTHFMQRFRYILVDEFQDTDPAQFEIVLAIAGDLQPTTDCLFIVGDPKQSIYLFREADVTRFKEAQDLVLSTCQGHVINLDTSFRSTKEVLGLTNSIFSRLFASAEKPWEFGYEPIRTSAARSGHSGHIELMLPQKGEDTKSGRHNEADMVARRIRSLVNGTPAEVYEEEKDRTFTRRRAQYGDIAILLEQRTNLPIYLSALNRYGIPYYVHGGTGFYERQEILDIYNTLAYLENQRSNIHLAGLLRSPYMGISDADLYLASTEKGFSFREKFFNYGINGSSDSCTRAVALLMKWESYAGRCGLVALIRMILLDSGAYTLYSSLPEGVAILANIEKLVRIAAKREEDGQYSLSSFIADLRLSMEEEEREGEAPLDSLAQNTVNIMTVHAAKGLEFPIVFVPDMAMAFRERSDPIMSGDDPRMVGIKVPDPVHQYKASASPVFQLLKALEGQKERAERKRLFYVAITRARDILVMSGIPPDNHDISFDLAKNRIEWVFSALRITGDSIAAGEHFLDSGDDPGPLKLTIISDPEGIVSERGHDLPGPVIVPPACEGMRGQYSGKITEQERSGTSAEYTVSDLESMVKSDLKDPGTRQSLRDMRELPGTSSHGTIRGTVLHEVLRGRDPHVVCREYGIADEEFIRQCCDAVTQFRGSALMQRVKREFCELSVSLPVGNIRIRGTIDRLCEIEDGSWILIDYKTAPVTPGNYRAEEERYKVQMAVYMLAAERLVNKPVTGYLYFTAAGEFHRVEFDMNTVIETICDGLKRPS